MLYVYKTVRDAKAPGGARFEPELVHNKSGVGSSFDIADLNKDGKPDIVTATHVRHLCVFRQASCRCAVSTSAGARAEEIERRNTMSRSPVIAAAAAAVMVVTLYAADPGNFKPDASFKGSTLTGWHVVGDADWSAQNGELVGKAKPGANGGWLVMDKSFQDVQLYIELPLHRGLQVRRPAARAKTPDGGMAGVLSSLNEGDTGCRMR